MCIWLEPAEMKGAISVAPDGANQRGNLFPRVPFGHPGLHSNRPYRDSWVRNGNLFPRVRFDRAWTKRWRAVGHPGLHSARPYRDS